MASVAALIAVVRLELLQIYVNKILKRHKVVKVQGWALVQFMQVKTFRLPGRVEGADSKVMWINAAHYVGTNTATNIGTRSEAASKIKIEDKPRPCLLCPKGQQQLRQAAPRPFVFEFYSLWVCLVWITNRALRLANAPWSRGYSGLSAGRLRVMNGIDREI